MASFPNKVIAQVAFKAGGNIFHHLLADNPKHLAKATPVTIQACDLHQGNYGVNGSVVQWKYTLDGKPQIAKQVLENIDKEKKQISWKTVEGDMLELYKRITTTVHVETKSGVDFVTWTLDYELIDADKPHPLPVLNLLIELTKELEAHIFGVNVEMSGFAIVLQEGSLCVHAGVQISVRFKLRTTGLCVGTIVRSHSGGLHAWLATGVLSLHFFKTPLTTHSPLFSSPEEAPVHTTCSRLLISLPEEAPVHQLYDQVLQVPTPLVRRKKLRSIRCIIKFFKFQLVLQIQFQL
ncbi:hypothetical protein C2S52_010249 [Perilla frutescens var. hirtella]|nr:hypothetical protein C2S52_010249 [Perilla frutescens var. hirtella]KAH6817123.1 hypothetical protein C2S51_000726 [Perilla frutescens var. frutescens]